eukprot:896411-Lingulodinium_polyedra.AAC.1
MLSLISFRNMHENGALAPCWTDGTRPAVIPPSRNFATELDGRQSNPTSRQGEHARGLPPCY